MFSAEHSFRCSSGHAAVGSRDNWVEFVMLQSPQNSWEVQEKPKIIWSVGTAYVLFMRINWIQKTSVIFPRQRPVCRTGEALPRITLRQMLRQGCVYYFVVVSTHSLAIFIHPLAGHWTFSFCRCHAGFSNLLFHCLPSFFSPWALFTVSPRHKRHLIMFEFKSNFRTHDVRLVWN